MRWCCAAFCQPYQNTLPALRFPLRSGCPRPLQGCAARLGPGHPERQCVACQQGLRRNRARAQGGRACARCSSCGGHPVLQLRPSWHGWPSGLAHRTSGSCPCPCSPGAVRGAGHPDRHDPGCGGAAPHHQGGVPRHQEGQAQGGAAARGAGPGRQVSIWIGRVGGCDFAIDLPALVARVVACLCQPLTCA